MSTAKFNTWQNPDGTENYKCRSWVNFDGTTTPPTIRASGNVSSVTRNGTGDYTVNFATAMPDDNFSAGAYAHHIGSSGWYRICVGPQNIVGQTSSTFRLHTVNVAYNLVNTDFVLVQIFR